MQLHHKDIKIKEITYINKELIMKISDNMREIDKKECLSVGFENPYQALHESINNSTKAYIATYRDVPMCAFGIDNKKTELGCMIWCLGVKDLEKYKKPFISISKNIIEQWQKEYGQLYNFVLSENDNCIKWLSWLGAKVHPADENDFRLFVLGGE